MDKLNLESELAKLKAEVATLKNTQKQQTQNNNDTSEHNEQALQHDLKQQALDMLDELKESAQNSPQIQQSLNFIEKEFKDIPTIPCLTIFALGILVGRFLR